MSNSQEKQETSGGTTFEAPILSINDSQRAEFVKSIIEQESDVTEVKIGLDSFGPWSNSKYKSLKKCPFQYYLKYVVKFKVPEKYQIQSDPSSANVGKAAHEILEHLLQGKSVDKSFALAKKNYVDKGILTEEQWGRRVEILHFNISKFKDRIDDFNRANPIKRVITELRLGFTRQFEATGFFSDDVWVRGVVDLVLILESLDTVIIDHKTGGGQGPVTPYEEQLDWYKVLFHFGVEKAKGIQTGIHFIGEGDVKMAKYSPASDIEGNIRNCLVMSLEGAIEMLLEKGYFKHVRGGHCKWCEYDSVGCKSGELKELELSTKRWIEIHKCQIQV